MKYLKKYENVTFDIDFAMAKIRNKFSEENVKSMLSKEIEEWADDDFYLENGNGEAEEIVIHQMIAWFKKEYSKNISEQEESSLEDSIRDKYECIN
jgi:hypothetical protein